MSQATLVMTPPVKIVDMDVMFWSDDPYRDGENRKGISADELQELANGRPIDGGEEALQLLVNEYLKDGRHPSDFSGVMVYGDGLQLSFVYTDEGLIDEAKWVYNEG